jgi:hypothetical protein
MATLVTKYELARIKGFDPRAIARFNIQPVGKTPAGRIIYNLDDANQIIERHLQSRRLKKHLTK